MAASASARTLMCGSVHARTPKLCAKLRVAPRSPPEAELRLSSLFSGSVFQLREERDGETVCLFCGSSNSAAHGERVQNTAQHKDPSHTRTRTNRRVSVRLQLNTELRLHYPGLFLALLQFGNFITGLGWRGCD